MSESIRVQDGSKAATFDGFVLEVFGLTATSRRIAINTIEKVAANKSGDELMFLVKTTKGGFGLAVSLAKRDEWDALVLAVNQAVQNQPK